MRRLPVYLLLDTSYSMLGEPIEAVKNGLQVLVSTIRQDPQALETVHLSIITFDSSAKQLCPLTELASFQLPNLTANGSTAMGEALELLSQTIGNEIIITTPERKGDWRPLIFIMTDGEPTDNWQKGVEALKKIKTGIIVACAAGPNANNNILKQIAEVVVQLDTADSATIKAFFKWVSCSISTGAKSVGTHQKEVGGLDDLPPPPPEINVVF